MKIENSRVFISIDSAQDYIYKKYKAFTDKFLHDNPDVTVENPDIYAITEIRNIRDLSNWEEGITKLYSGTIEVFHVKSRDSGTLEIVGYLDNHMLRVNGKVFGRYYDLLDQWNTEIALEEIAKPGVLIESFSEGKLQHASKTGESFYLHSVKDSNTNNKWNLIHEGIAITFEEGKFEDTQNVSSVNSAFGNPESDQATLANAINEMTQWLKDNYPELL